MVAVHRIRFLLRGGVVVFMIELLNIDCMEYMATQPDNAFDLAVVDPPFGLNDINKNKLRASRGHETTYTNKEIPSPEYFQELARTSKESVIFGCQYFLPYLYTGGSFVVWDKGADPDLHHMSSCDVAWYSKRKQIKTFRGHWCGAAKFTPRESFHPHEKPVKLYDWILQNYAKPGQRILDTHLGSGSSAIAAHYYGVDFVGCELDPDYYKAACERFDQATKQKTLF